MKVAVISDVHSNFVAFKAVKADMESIGVDVVHCLGDTVGYGPRPLECLNAVLGISKTVLKGNHEDAVCNPSREDDLNKFAIAGVRFSRKQLTLGIIDGLERFLYTKQLPEIDFVLCHGSYTEPSMWKYIDSPAMAEEELKHTPNRFCLVGHTHNPFVFDSNRGLHRYIRQDLKLKAEKYIINVGSVGQPRDGDCRSCYGVFNINDGKVVFNLRRVFYDISKVEAQIREAEIPIQLAERLYSGE